MIIGRRATQVALAIILLCGLSLRLSAVRFGLPSLYDPDEPMFMLVALKMLTSGSLNPHWFGHPGSTTIYLIAALDAAVAAISILSHQFANVGEFTKAAYADPGLLFIPARTAMALIGVGAVWMTYGVGSRLFGRTAGLLAAGLVAINPLHVAWSAVVRTDIQAGLFMLASLYFAAGAAKTNRARDYLLAAAFAGFATATKWPAASVLVALAGAAITGAVAEPRTAATQARRFAVSIAAYIAAVFVASPFIFLDWRTVLGNVSGELKPGHLAHTGHGLVSNMWWYLVDPIGQSMGICTLLFALGGIAVAARHSIARATILPAALAFLVLISGQRMIWARWVLPVLPMLAIFAAAALVSLCRQLEPKLRSRAGWLSFAALTAVVAVPAAAATAAQIRERSNDTRMQAARWAREHLPAGSTVVLEHLELSLRDEPWRIIFPLGDAGCVDARQLLKQKVDVDRVQKVRAGSAIVDLGNVRSSKIASCRADYAILTYYDLYMREQARFPGEVANYRAILRGGRTVALFKAEPGRAGGPTVRVVAIQRDLSTTNPLSSNSSG